MSDQFEHGLRWWHLYPQDNDRYFSSKWNPSSLEEMRRSVLNDLFPIEYGKIQPGSHRYLHDFEETQSIKAYKQGLTDYDPVLNTFEYFINDYGFRGVNQPILEGKNIAFFGCSFTFGVGLPEEDHFVSMLGHQLKTNVLNFGIPGGSASRIARMFYLLTKYQKIDFAVFNMPHFGRIEYPVSHGTLKPILVNIITNFRHLSPEEDAVRSKLADSLSDEYLMYDFIKNVSFIETVAELRNIRTFYTSWDIPVHNLLSTHFNDQQEKLLPWFQFVEYKDTHQFKRARDGAHPGRESNRVFVERCKPYLEKYVNG